MLYLSTLPLAVPTKPKLPHWLMHTAVTGARTVPSSSCFGGSDRSWSASLHADQRLSTGNALRLTGFGPEHCSSAAAARQSASSQPCRIRPGACARAPVPRQLPRVRIAVAGVGAEKIRPVAVPHGAVRKRDRDRQLELLLVDA